LADSKIVGSYYLLNFMDTKFSFIIKIVKNKKIVER